MEWTKEQKEAIQTKDCKLLVAAGAGSGKTAVLVERIIRKVIDDKIDIDKLLVVTFTNAAASEMRERIQKAIYANIDTYPELNKQILLLNKASIMTIDAFCKKVIKDNFFNLDLDPNFGVCDTTENELLKLETLDEVLEELYESSSEIVDLYSDNKSDEGLRNLISSIYNFIQSSPYPEKWLNEKCEMYNVTDETDFGKTVWGRELIKFARAEILGCIEELEVLEEDLKDDADVANYLITIQDDISQLKALRLNNVSWDDFYNGILKIKFITLKRAPKADEDTAEKVKEIRNKMKDKINKFLKEEVFVSSSKEIFEDMRFLYKALLEISNAVISFGTKFKEKKKAKNLVDFSDMEHICLELLDSNENVANMYKSQYEEILVDEYQDSNLIQEFILNKISRGNIFMVGDVKQSIYRFRQARPELFLEKYNSYKLIDDAKENDDKKILLFKNFRSNENIIDQCNFIFKSTMSEDVGEINYDENEYLKFGAEYYPQKGTEAEIHFIEKGISEDENLDDVEDDIEDKPQLEARVVSKRISELIGNFEIYDKETKVMRKAEYRDVVILLRATKNYADSFVTELSARNIPVFADVNSGYFDKMEVQIMMSLLKIIDNPYQDIPLLAVLRSKVGDFEANELTDIRLVDKNCSFFEAMQKSATNGNKKVLSFLNKLSSWREKSKYLGLGELIWLLYNETGYYSYISLMPNGNIRTKNLDALLEKAEKYDSTSYRGLFNFITFMDNLKETSGDMGSSKSISETDNVVRIMSIHKSKGLEFPIVFLSGTARKFNTRDQRNPVILHQDMGFGADVINLENRVTYESIPKIALKQKIKEECLSEEMRILYVALTRAREKLIVTVMNNNLQKKKDNWSRKQTPYIVSKATSFADWICGTVLSTTNDWKLFDWSYKDVLLLKEEEDNNAFNRFISNIENEFEKTDEYNVIEKKFSWKYPYSFSTKLPSKITVTELKRLGDELSENSNENLELIPSPVFMDESLEAGTNFGTLLHNVMQRLNFHNLNFDEVLNSVEEKYRKSVKNYLEQFIKTNLYKEILAAKNIWREMPFNLSVRAGELYHIDDESKNDNILIQGVIDLYYETSDGLILVDYKTDHIDTSNEFIKKYKSQLDYYKKALESLTGKKVIKAIIYSFHLDREIEVS